jgi:hypothetical protein
LFPRTCKITLQSINYDLLSNMTALPFLVDFDGSGRISFFTFTEKGRTVVQYDLSAPTRTL